MPIAVTCGLLHVALDHPDVSEGGACGKFRCDDADLRGRPHC